jgi:hypothetical protein
MADVVRRRIRHGDPYATGVVRERGPDHACRHLREASGADRIKAASTTAAGWENHHRPHTPAIWPMLAALTLVHHGT